MYFVFCRLYPLSNSNKFWREGYLDNEGLFNYCGDAETVHASVVIVSH